MQAPSSKIAVIYDSPAARDGAVAALAGYFTVTQIPLEQFADEGPFDAEINVFCVNAGEMETTKQVKKALQNSQAEALFILPTHNSDGISRLRGIKRAYKGSMTSEAALDMMGSFEGHLDMDLLRSFRSFVLDQGHSLP